MSVIKTVMIMICDMIQGVCKSFQHKTVPSVSMELGVQGKASCAHKKRSLPQVCMRLVECQLCSLKQHSARCPPESSPPSIKSYHSAKCDDDRNTESGVSPKATKSQMCPLQHDSAKYVYPSKKHRTRCVHKTSDLCYNEHKPISAPGASSKVTQHQTYERQEY